MHGYIEHTIDYTLLLYIYYIYLYFPGCRCVCVCVQLHCNYCEILLQRIFYDGCCFLPSPSRFRSTFTSTSTVTLHVRKYYICYMLYARCYMYVWAGGVVRLIVLGARWVGFFSFLRKSQKQNTFWWWWPTGKFILVLFSSAGFWLLSPTHDIFLLLSPETFELMRPGLPRNNVFYLCNVTESHEDCKAVSYYNDTSPKK